MTPWKIFARPRGAAEGPPGKAERGEERRAEQREEERREERQQGRRGVPLLIAPSRWPGLLESYRRGREKEKQDLNVYEVLSDGARPSIEYYALTVLSCIIATAGLITGSTAVIIGAMIVAPLMTPILAFSLAVVWGDLALVRNAVFSLLRGVILAVGISALIALLVPIAAPSAEIVSRTHPTLYDIIVALVAGVLGAYGYANRRINSAVVGIAIAVALMPPLCTVGIEIGKGAYSAAAGASLLFAVNLVSISLSGSVVFLLMKIHPRSEADGSAKRRALYQIVVSAALLVAIAVPVAAYVRTGYIVEQSRQAAARILTGAVPGSSVFTSEALARGGGYILRLTVIGTRDPQPAELQEARAAIRSQCPVFERTDITFLKALDLPDGG